MQSNAKQGKAIQSKATQSKTSQSNATQSTPTQCKAKQSKAKQSEQCKAKQSNAKQCKAKLSNAKQCNAMQKGGAAHRFGRVWYTSHADYLSDIMSDFIDFTWHRLGSYWIFWSPLRAIPTIFGPPDRWIGRVIFLLTYENKKI